MLGGGWGEGGGSRQNGLAGGGVLDRIGWGWTLDRARARTADPACSIPGPMLLDRLTARGEDVVPTLHPHFPPGTETLASSQAEHTSGGVAQSTDQLRGGHPSAVREGAYLIPAKALGPRLVVAIREQSSNTWVWEGFERRSIIYLISLLLGIDCGFVALHALAPRACGHAIASTTHSPLIGTRLLYTATRHTTPPPTPHPPFFPSTHKSLLSNHAPNTSSSTPRTKTCT